MKQWLGQQSAVFYFMMITALVGLVMTAVANNVYKRLIKDTDDVENSANRLIKYIKLKYTSYYKLGLKPYDVKAMVQSYFAKYKVGPLTLKSWSVAGILSQSIVVITAIAYILFNLSYGKRISDLYTFIGAALIAVCILAVQNKLYDFGEKQATFCWNMYDYLSNFLKNKIENGKTASQSDMADMAESMQNNYQQFKARKGESQAAATSVPFGKMSADKEKSFGRMAMDDEIDAKIVEDILKEFLN